MDSFWVSLVLVSAFTASIRGDEKYYSTEAFKHPVAEALFDFGYQLYKESQTGATSDNLVISPESVYSALALVLPGLNGDSLVEVEKALGGMHLADIVGEHNMMNKDIFDDPGAQYQIHRASRLYVDEVVHLKKQYKSDIFDSVVDQNAHKRVDFQHDPDAARERINKYVENHTGGEITEFLSENQVTTLTRLFLVTALSLQAEWNHAFSKTKQGDFQTADEESVKANYMIATGAQCYPVHDEDNGQFSGVRIPFKNSELSMMIIMPTSVGDFTTITSHDIKSALGDVSGAEAFPSTCQLIVPKFSVKTDIDDLIPSLQRMGISSIFNPDVADLSNMLQEDTEDIYVSDVTHVASLEVDEMGIKATAATGVGFSSRMVPRTVLIDKPFLFMIRHEATGSTLFLGKITKPQE